MPITCDFCGASQGDGAQSFHQTQASKYAARFREVLCRPGPWPRLCGPCYHTFTWGFRTGRKTVMIKSYIRGGGQGVIALVRLEPGEIVEEYSGARVRRHTDEAALFGSRSHQRAHGDQIIEARCAVNKFGGGRAGYINRACPRNCKCEPRLPTCARRNNCKIVTFFDKTRGELRTVSRVLRATKEERGCAILPGEELLQAYNNGQSNPPPPRSARVGRPRKKEQPPHLSYAYRSKILPTLQAERFRVPVKRFIDEKF